MGKIVILSHYYPPYGMVGGERMKRLYEYLKKTDREVLLISGYNTGEGISYGRIDPGEGYGFDYRIRNILKIINKIVFPIDNKMVNIPVVYKVLKKVLNRDDLLIVSLPPPSLSIVAAHVSWLKGCKLIVDFRDMWCCNNDSISNWRFLDKIFENYVIGHSSCITTSSPLMKEKYEKRYKKRVFSVFTGAYKIPEIKVKKKDKYTIIYGGRIRRLNMIDRFLKCFSSLNDDIKSKYEIHIYGKDENVGIENIIKKLKLSNAKYFGWVKREDFNKSVEKADILLLPIRGGNGLDSVIPYKFYEYLSFDKPILGFTDKNNYINKIIEKRGIVIYNNCNNMEEVLKGFPKNIGLGDCDFLSVKESMKEWEKVLSYCGF